MKEKFQDTLHETVELLRKVKKTLSTTNKTVRFRRKRVDIDDMYYVINATIDEIDKIEHNEIVTIDGKKLKVKKKIMAFGETDEYPKYLNQIIPYCEHKFRDNAIYGTGTVKAYKCYCGTYDYRDLKSSVSNMIVHHAYKDSWLCILLALGNPKYIIMIEK